MSDTHDHSHSRHGNGAPGHHHDIGGRGDWQVAAAVAVNLSLTIEDIFAVAAEEARRLLPFDRLTIALAEEDAAATDGEGARRTAASFSSRVARRGARWP